MYAIIESGGKQFRVSQGDVIFVEKLPAEIGATVEFDRVLLIGSDAETKVGAPLIPNARAVGKVLEQGKGPKIRVFKYKNKINYRRRQGHRQPYSKVQIESIQA